MHGGKPIVAVVIDGNGRGAWLIGIQLFCVGEGKIRIENMDPVGRAVRWKLKAAINFFAAVVWSKSDGKCAENVETDLTEGGRRGLAVVAVDHVVVRIVSARVFFDNVAKGACRSEGANILLDYHRVVDTGEAKTCIA